MMFPEPVLCGEELENGLYSNHAFIAGQRGHLRSPAYYTPEPLPKSRCPSAYRRTAAGLEWHCKHLNLYSSIFLDLTIAYFFWFLHIKYFYYSL